MNKFLAGTAAIVLGLAVSTVANAATDWTGYYLGANAGFASGDSTAKTSTVYSATGYFAATSVTAINAIGAQKLSNTGFTGGVTGGYNVQTGNTVYGLELDFGTFDVSDSRTGTAVYPCCSPTAFTLTQKEKSSWLFTARPRLGWVSGNYLFYGTGGLAMTDEKYNERFTDTYATALQTSHISKTMTGWTLGAGIEANVGTGWTMKAEYLYADFGSVSGSSTNLTAYAGPLAFPTNVFSNHMNLTANIFRIGLNYHW